MLLPLLRIKYGINIDIERKELRKEGIEEGRKEGRTESDQGLL
jgi:hypothetical protein